MGIIIAPDRTLLKPIFGCDLELNLEHPRNIGLVAWWLFYEGAGAIAQSVVSRHPMTLAAGSTWAKISMPPANVPEIDCSGTGSGMSASSVPIPLNTGTIIFRGFTDTNSSEANFRFFFDTDGTRHAFYKVNASNQFQMYIDGYYTNFNSGWSWVVGQSLYLAFVYDKASATQKFFQNAVEIAETSHAGTWGSTALGTSCYIGQQAASVGGGLLFDGRVGSVEVYNRMLSKAEIYDISIYPYGRQDNPRFVVETRKAYTFGTGILSSSRLLNPDLRGVMQGANRGMVI